MSHLTYFNQNEQARLNALRDLGLLDTPPSESFDRLTRLASRLLKAPVSTISLTDADRQWFKSRVGVDLTEIPRDQAPCAYAIQGDGVFEIPDLLADPRFRDSPLAQAGIRFYAGAPLFTRAGYGLGTLAVIDALPRSLSAEESRILQDLAGMVMCQVEMQNMIGRTDAGSGLPNQYQLYEDLEGLANQDPDRAVALLAVDMFSAQQAEHMMRALGAPHIDALTQVTMQHLQSAFGRSTRLYHVGPHRCAFLMTATPGEAFELPGQVLETLASQIVIGDIPTTPQPIVGIYDYELGRTAARDALRRATNALEDARRANRQSSRYDHTSERHAARRFTLLTDFAAALASDTQLALVYQPRVALHSGCWVGAEALIRWQHPGLGTVSPAEFVPLVERTALARGLTDWVARHAIHQARLWRDAGHPVRVSINASAMNLVEEDFATRLLQGIRAEGIEPDLIEVEFTESAMASDRPQVVSQLTELRRHGVAVAIDDFGTGFSNLAYLQRLPASVLKIDQSFVRDLALSAKDQRLVQTMIAMARDLEYGVVAEGIESGRVYDLLVGWGCDEGQGYHLARPMSASALTDALSGARPRRGSHRARLGSPAA